MSHASKATPNHPAVAYLVRLHADIGAKLLDNKKEASERGPGACRRARGRSPRLASHRAIARRVKLGGSPLMGRA